MSLIDTGATKDGTNAEENTNASNAIVRLILFKNLS